MNFLSRTANNSYKLKKSKPVATVKNSVKILCCVATNGYTDRASSIPLLMQIQDTINTTVKIYSPDYEFAEYLEVQSIIVV